jgi:hypothetical protein
MPSHSNKCLSNWNSGEPCDCIVGEPPAASPGDLQADLYTRHPDGFRRVGDLFFVPCPDTSSDPARLTHAPDRADRLAPNGGDSGRSNGITDRVTCSCGGVMFGDGNAHTSACPAFEGIRPRATSPGVDVLATLDRAQALVNDLSKGTKRWTMCVPPQADDPDMLLSGAFTDAKELIQELRAELAAARAIIAERAKC